MWGLSLLIDLHVTHGHRKCMKVAFSDFAIQERQAYSSPDSDETTV